MGFKGIPESIDLITQVVPPIYWSTPIYHPTTMDRCLQLVSAHPYSLNPRICNSGLRYITIIHAIDLGEKVKKPYRVSILSRLKIHGVFHEMSFFYIYG
jgi:hypothetical protein